MATIDKKAGNKQLWSALSFCAMLLKKKQLRQFQVGAELASMSDEQLDKALVFLRCNIEDLAATLKVVEYNI